MNRALLITIGILIILIMIGVWGYLMYFGTPQSPAQVFANLGYHSTSQPVTIAPSATTTTAAATSSPTTSTAALRQLTTRSVAGFTFVTSTTSTSSEIVRFVERGTGHVYDINLTSGDETLVSGTTIPAVNGAVFSPDGSTIAFTSYVGYNRTIFIGTLNGNKGVSGTNLPAGARNLAFMSNTLIAYTLSGNGMTKGFEQNLATKTRSQVFSINFENIAVAWGSNLNDIYVYTRPAKNFQGFVYRVKNGVLTPIGDPGYGLTAFFSNHHVIESSISDSAYGSSVLSPATGTSTPLPLLSLPSKCSFDHLDPNVMWCAAPVTSVYPADTLSSWYKGTTRFSDEIWRVQLTSQQAFLYADPQSLVKQTLDIEDTAIDQSDHYFLMRNKADDTLWLVDTTVTSS